jgi:hypothetical protein
LPLNGTERLAYLGVYLPSSRNESITTRACSGLLFHDPMAGIAHHRAAHVGRGERAARSDHDSDAHLEALRVVLRELSPDEIISFEAAFRRYLNEAYNWDLGGAVYVVHGGCSDDGFEYFRRWLVSRGRDVYEPALADPDSLAQLEVRPGPDGVWEFEEIYYVAKEVFEEKVAKATCATIPSRKRAWVDLGLPASLSRTTTSIWPGVTRISGGVLGPNRLAESFIDPWTALALCQ